MSKELNVFFLPVKKLKYLAISETVYGEIILQQNKTLFFTKLIYVS